MTDTVGCNQTYPFVPVNHGAKAEYAVNKTQKNKVGNREKFQSQQFPHNKVV